MKFNSLLSKNSVHSTSDLSRSRSTASHLPDDIHPLMHFPDTPAKRWLLAFDLRIIPYQIALTSRMIEVCAFITELCLIRKYDKTVSKPFRNIELLFILYCQLHSVPLSISLTSRTQIHRNIDLVFHTFFIPDNNQLVFIAVFFQTLTHQLFFVRQTHLHMDCLHAPFYYKPLSFQVIL